MTFPDTLRPLLREPLVHFLLAGCAVFLVSAWRGEAVDPASRTISIDAAQVSRLVASWQQTWRRPPTPAEIDGLIAEFVREEVYYREAIRLGLDTDDMVIRRRLRSKMEFLAEQMADAASPDDATLKAWMDRNPARYATGAAYSFDQIFLGRDGAGGAPAARAALAKGQAWQELGQPLSVPGTMNSAPRGDIARQFGDGFAEQLASLKPGDWAGPVASGFGDHLVRLRTVTAATPPRLAEVRQAVENDWRAETGRARSARAYQALLDGYTIRIARP